MIRTITSAALVAASILAVAPAAAQDAPTRKVSYADLDLTTAAGKHTLDGRVIAAIRAVCPQPAFDSAETVMEYQKCRTTARLGSRTQVADAVNEAVQMASRSGTIEVASR